MKKTISVAIPVFNGARFIKEAIYSIFSQTIEVDEILICDNSSTDDTVSVVENIIKLNPNKNILLIQNKQNYGYAKNWNICLENSSSDYVLLLHADDLLRPKGIETLIDFLKKNIEYGLVGGQEFRFNENGEGIYEKAKGHSKLFEKGQILEFVRDKGSYIPCSSVMFDMEKIRKVGFFQEGVLATDELYWPEVLQYYPIAVLGKFIINRRTHNGQTEYDDFKNKKREIIRSGNHFDTIIEYEKRADEKRLLAKLIKIKKANALISISRSVIVHHHSLRLSFFYIVNSVKVFPLILLTKIFWKSHLKSLLIYLGIFNIK